VHIPEYLEECELVPGEDVTPRLEPEKAHPGIDWDYLVGDTQHRIEQLAQRKKRLAAMGWVHQTEIRDNLVDINGRLSQLLSEVYPEHDKEITDN
jgi:metallo-beta-lactamase family protein